MIGTTLKVGFDSSAVNRGLGGLGGKLKGFMGRVGIGAMERVGHRMTDLMGRIVTAIPEALQETMDWAGGLTDMSTATGMSIERLIHLEEMFRLAGVSAKESGAVVGKFILNVKKGAEEGGGAADALEKLGLDIQDIAAMRPDVMFETVAKSLANFTGEASALEPIMAELFGAKLGYQQLKLFKDFDAVSARAALNVGGLARALGGDLAGKMDNFGDALGRFENFKRSLASIALDELMKISGANAVDDFFDMFDPEKLRQPIADFMGMIRGTFSYIKSEGGIMNALKGEVQELGKMLGNGIIESFKSSGLTIKDLLFSSNTSASDKSKAIDLSKTEGLLQEIKLRVGTAKFA